MTQKEFSELTGVPFGTIRNYEAGQFEVGLKVIDAVLELERFEKYMMWLMKGKTNPGLGQIAPPLSPDGFGNSEESQDTTTPEAKSHR
ncbi:helix-turn-helix transcriptional regulator [Salmonella enterica subsp. arizonae]|nr:helix-turn-helix transcriptional regulator [Salmonella enterica subsp. arizonae]